MFTLPGTELVNIKKINEKENTSTFIIEPLLPGYGMTIGNSLRRVLLSSLPGSAITWVKIAGTTHEFSSIPGVKEDIVDIILNLKGLKVKLLSEEEAVLKLNAKGPGVVTAKDFSKNAQVEIPDSKYHIATLDKNGKLNIEATIKNGRGYVTVEQRKDEKLPLGTIAIDSIFTPIKKVHYEVDNTRVGGMTNYDKLTINLTTDGTINPDQAMHTAAKILTEHFDIVKAVFTDKKATPNTTKKTKVKKETSAKKSTAKKTKKVKND